MIRAALILWCLASAALADPVDDWIDLQSQPHRAVLAAIRADEILMGYHHMCPADVFPATNRRAMGSEPCSETIGLCLTQCIAGWGDACFGVARAIELEMSDTGEATLKYPMYMAACEDGNANGCTNAGAAAKQGSWIDGTGPSTAATRQCQYRTYAAACSAGASWGCYMLGVEWEFEGVDDVFDTDQARAAWQRSCDLNPDGGACVASQQELDRLTARE